jgi:secondary thiamine-phosphate synthase enzyme
MTGLRHHGQTLAFDGRGQGFLPITAAVDDAIAAAGFRQGIAVLLALHTSCSLTINENADPRVLDDLQAHLAALVPEAGSRPLSGDGPLRPYRHDDEGPDDMPAHIRTALTCTSLSLPVAQGRLLLGTWQAVYLWEHRRQPLRRRVRLDLLGS